MRTSSQRRSMRAACSTSPVRNPHLGEKVGESARVAVLRNRPPVTGLHDTITPTFVASESANQLGQLRFGLVDNDFAIRFVVVLEPVCGAGDQKPTAGRNLKGAALDLPVRALRRRREAEADTALFEDRDHLVLRASSACVTSPQDGAAP